MRQEAAALGGQGDVGAGLAALDARAVGVGEVGAQQVDRLASPRPLEADRQFRPVRQRVGALGAARTELIIGLACLGMAGAAIAVLPGSGIATMLAVGVVLQGLTYLAAPAMAVVAERDLRRRLDSEPSEDWDTSVSFAAGL